MKIPRQWMILGGLFIVLLAYVLFTQTGDKGFNTLQLPKLPEMKSENVRKITIEKSGGKVVLANTDKEWQLIEPRVFAVDKNKMSALLRAVGELRITSLVTDRKDAAVDFGLTSGTAVYLTVEEKSGKKMQLTIGATNTNAAQTFVQFPNDTKVYQLLGDITQQLNRKPLDWRSTVIFDFSPDQVQKITITQKGKPAAVLVKEQQPETKIVTESPKGVTPTALPMKLVWKSPGQPKPLNDGSVNQFLGTFCRLASIQLLDDQPWNGGEPLARIEVENSDKTKQSLEILVYKKDAGQYWVRRDKEIILYAINDFQTKSLLKSTKDFE